MHTEKNLNYKEEITENTNDINENMTFCKKRKISGCFSKSKNRKEPDPIPMKLRALPRSFWQQPNHPTKSDDLCPELPLLTTEENHSGIQPLSSPAEEITTPANTELLFSLFRVIDNNKSLIRRGRAKKSNIQTGLRDSDPCLVSTLNESPLLVTNKGRENGQNNSYSNLLAELVVRL